MEGSRHALVVANDEYADPGLRRLVAPAHDAAALAEVLQDPAIGHFEVRVLHNESAQTIRLAIEEFFVDRAPEDLLLLHFSCHGLKNAAGELFLAVADTRPTRLASTALSADFVNRQMADSRAQRIALLLDCCYGGAFPRGMVVRAAGEAHVRDAFARQEQVGGGRGRVVVTASSAMEYAFEGEHLAASAQPMPSVFTNAVVEALSTGEADRDGDGWVGLTELVGFVTDRVNRVTPNQNPQMWTFGAQGELLIARSRIRRITPTPLPQELLEAMDSPLAATRYGVVDELRERVEGADLGQAFAAWRALQRMVDDDSRKVSEAAQRWVGSVAPQVPSEVLDLGTVRAGNAATGEFRLGGPPLALTAAASSPTAWIRVEQTGPVVRVSAEPPEAGSAEGTVTVQGPTGERTVTIRLELVQLEPGPAAVGPAPVAVPPAPPAASEPEPQPAPEPRPQPEPEPQQQPEPALISVPLAQPPAAAPQLRPAGRTPWWAVATLVVAALILVGINWPSTEGRVVWKDDDSGWEVLRTRWDPFVLASFLPLAGALIARWSSRRANILLGLVTGSALFLAVSGVIFLAGDVAYEYEAGAWTVSTVVAASIVGIVLHVTRPKPGPLWPVNPAALAMVFGGGLLLVVGDATTYSGASFLTVTRGTGLLGAVALVALAWPALAAGGGRADRLLFATAAATYALLDMYSNVPALDALQTAAFRLALAGNVLVLVGVALAVWRPLRQPSGQLAEPLLSVREPATAARSWWQAPWVTAVGMAAGALLLLYVSWTALNDDQHLWYDSNEGSPELYREWYDGSLFTALTALVAAPLTVLGVRVAAYALGVVAGAAALFGTAGVVIIGGGLAYEDAVYAWSASLVVAAVMVALALTESGRRGRSPTFRPPRAAASTLLVAGLLILVAAQLGTNGGTSAISYTEAFALLLPLVPAALVLMAATGMQSAGYHVAFGAAASYLALVSLSAIYPIRAEVAPTYFTAILGGHLVLLAALLPGLVRLVGQDGPTGSAGEQSERRAADGAPRGSSKYGGN